MTLCNTCTKADVSCPIYPQETQECVEYTHPLDAILPALRAEYDQSLSLHDADEWAELSTSQMLNAMFDEMEEFVRAKSSKDMTGEHGMIAESLQVAVTALRAYSELLRRRAE